MRTRASLLSKAGREYSSQKLIKKQCVQTSPSPETGWVNHITKKRMQDLKDTLQNPIPEDGFEMPVDL